MGRVIDLDEELGFEEYKPAVKFYGRKWYVNAGPDTILKIKILDKKTQEKVKNAKKSKNNDSLGEIEINYYREMFIAVFGEEQAKEIFDLGLTNDQIDAVIRAVTALFANKEFNPNISEDEKDEKKTN